MMLDRLSGSKCSLRTQHTKQIANTSWLPGLPCGSFYPLGSLLGTVVLLNKMSLQYVCSLMVLVMVACCGEWTGHPRNCVC